MPENNRHTVTDMSKKIKNNNQSKMISAKDIMSRYNISYQTVNHYTDIGLLPVMVKEGNERFYAGALVDKRLKKIRSLTKEGYSLRLVRKLLVGI